MKAWSIYLERRAGEFLVAFLISDRLKHCRNIVTYHAEDGSGVGSAIIAGMQLSSIASSDCLTVSAAMTKIRKENGLFAHV